MQDPDYNNDYNNNNNDDDRLDFKRKISLPMSRSPNPYTNNIEEEEIDTGDWSHTTTVGGGGGGGYQIPTEQPELRYDGGKGSDF